MSQSIPEESPRQTFQEELRELRKAMVPPFAAGAVVGGIVFFLTRDLAWSFAAFLLAVYVVHISDKWWRRLLRKMF